MILLNKDELQERFKLLDEDATLLFGDENRYHVIIAGGGALVFMGYTSRATTDIDVLDATRALYDLFEKYQMNGRIAAYENSFLFNYPDRLKHLWSGEKIDFYSVSLEDLIVSKLYAFRVNDRDDLKTAAPYVNWEKLERLVSSEDELRTLMMSENSYFYFTHAYKEYIEEYKP